ncbi:hypothetical protein EVAR_15664_1 [Eumeta japonica]|uniref:Uncharacterized protein n=1 Tax=Eumeta variegata TaxID=151549 RepID=A0A4C1UA53_EUMVA|nr:hypothetical protein EVAR_15664_1 [Eumeta japonica]
MIPPEDPYADTPFRSRPDVARPVAGGVTRTARTSLKTGQSSNRTCINSKRSVKGALENVVETKVRDIKRLNLKHPNRGVSS